MFEGLYSYIYILVIAFIQNVAFSITSRSRNRNNKRYLMIASTFSNGIWFLTFKELVMHDMNFTLFIPYVIGNVFGSVQGVNVSMWIEKKIGALADPKENKERKE